MECEMMNQVKGLDEGRAQMRIFLATKTQLAK